MDESAAAYGVVHRLYTVRCYCGREWSFFEPVKLTVQLNQYGRCMWHSWEYVRDGE